MPLKGKNAVIYGAGGAIGGAVARAFAREGARVFQAATAEGAGGAGEVRRAFAALRGQGKPPIAAVATIRKGGVRWSV
jgi:NAD(P)-dependent dehydrogenase (short-subunit alcohol dehydrogenase family)